MKLSQDQKIILSEIQFLAKLPVTEMQRQQPGLKGKSTEKIRRFIQRALENEFIYCVPHINPGKVGKIEALLLCSIMANGVSGLPYTIVKHPWVTEVLATSGRYDFIISLRLDAKADLAIFLNDLVNLGCTITRRTIAWICGKTLYSRAYLSPGCEHNGLTINYACKPENLHPTEQKIIDDLWPFNTNAHALLAHSMGISRGALLYRLKTLEEKGALTGWSYELDALKVGSLCYDLFLSLSCGSSHIHENAIRFCNAEPNVTGLVTGIGGFDLHIIAEFQRPEEFSEFKQRLLGQFKGLLIDLVVLSRWQRVLRTLKYVSNVKKLLAA